MIIPIYAKISPRNSDYEETLSFKTLPQPGHTITLYTEGRRVTTQVLAIEHSQLDENSSNVEIFITTGPWIFCDNK